MTVPETRSVPLALRISHAMRSPAIAIVAWLAVIAMTCAAFTDIARNPAGTLVKSDFAAYYCGALVARTHGDPYALSTLAACEAGNVNIPGEAVPSAVGVRPASVPGYDLAFVMPLTTLPYHQAAMFWDLLIVAAIVATCFIMANLTELPLIAVAAIFSFIDGLASLPCGQTAPVVTFGLALAAYGLVRDRQWLTVIGAALTMLDPQLGLPVCGALFVWCSPLRLGIGTLVMTLGAISLGLLGLPLNVEYVAAELSAHALTGATAASQYGLTPLLHHLRLSDDLAIRAAAVLNAILALVGIGLARRVGRCLGTPAAIALFPAAVVLIGGSLISIGHTAAAVPFALVLAARTRHPLAWFALLLLVLPWSGQSQLAAVGAMAIAATIALVAVSVRSASVAVGAACAAVIAYVIIAGPIMSHLVPAKPQHVTAATPPMPLAIIGDRLASAEAAGEIRIDPNVAVATPGALAARLPIWIALCTVAGLTLSLRSTSARPVRD